MTKVIKTSIILLVLICVLQLVYIFFVTGVAQTTMPYKANGSLLYVDGKVVGSELIGQSFTSPGYFHGRPSAVDYDGAESAGSNLGPTSAKLMEQVSQRIEQVRQRERATARCTCAGGPGSGFGQRPGPSYQRGECDASGSACRYSARIAGIRGKGAGRAAY